MTEFEWSLKHDEDKNLEKKEVCEEFWMFNISLSSQVNIIQSFEGSKRRTSLDTLFLKEIQYLLSF